MEESQIGIEEITETAGRYQLKILDFMENDAASLVISYNRRDSSLAGIILAVAAVLYGVYRIAEREAQKTVGIS